MWSWFAASIHVDNLLTRQEASGLAMNVLCLWPQLFSIQVNCYLRYAFLNVNWIALLHGIKSRGEVAVQLHSFLALSLVGYVYLSLPFGCFTTGKREPVETEQNFGWAPSFFFFWRPSRRGKFLEPTWDRVCQVSSLVIVPKKTIKHIICHPVCL
jgi:hypothetical protein